MCGAADPVKVGGRIGAGEGDPEEVVEGTGGKSAVVNHQHDRKEVEDVGRGKRCGKTRHNRIFATAGSTAGRTVHRNNAGETKPRRGKSFRKAETGRKFRWQLPLFWP